MNTYINRRQQRIISQVTSAILLTCIAINMTGCVVHAGTPQAMREHMEGLNGLVATGKELDKQDKTYFTYQTARQSEETKRATAPSFFGELFAK